ncbi:ABC transporter permease [Pikeienuella sp. HZG-20]|uniref:ABC transporter permease n=1 Tax=Paludibacillus litoralis TaxID=3133267 RepID=UPI0030EF2B83
MTCAEAIIAYGLRSVGVGERILPRGDITLCEQTALIGSGMLWNIYFTVLALGFGFCLATVIALGKASPNRLVSGAARGFIFVFRGSPLFIQFFLFYEAFVLIPKAAGALDLGFVTITVETAWFTRAWLGALIVLILNTSAYSAEIFHGALMNVPKGEIEAADAMGMSGLRKFRRIVWPTMLRIAWPAYTNEAIFMGHATALVFFSGFPAWRREGDALYYATYFAEATFNPFVAYPIVAAFFVLFTLTILGVFGLINRRLNRHLPAAVRAKTRFRPQIIR